MKENKAHLKALTTLRFFAAFHVVLYHVAPSYFPDMPVWMLHFVGSGFTGVSLFFILSGFILAYNYLDKDPNAPVDKKTFWIARFARIYPMYLLGLVVALPIFLNDVSKWHQSGHSYTEPVLAVVTTIPLVQSWHTFFRPPWNALGWSLSVEAFFYLVFPFLAIPYKRLSKRSLYAVIVIAYLLIAIPPTLFQLHYPNGLIGQSTEFVDWWLWFLLGNPIFRLPEFLIGMAAGRLFILRRADRKESATAPTVHTLIAVAGILVVVSAFDPKQAWMLYAPMLAPFFLLLIYSLAKGLGPIPKLLSFNLGILVGEASYALYLIHSSIAVYFSKMSGAFGDLPPALVFTAYVVVVVAICGWLFNHFETPMRRKIRKRLTGSPGAGPV